MDKAIHHVETAHNEAVSTAARSRIRLLEQQLIDNEAARRQAARDGNRGLANDLANRTRELIIAADPNDLRSLVTIWLLNKGK